MSTLDAIKANIYSLVVKNGRVTIDKLLKWCQEQGISQLLLSLLLRELEQEKKLKLIDNSAVIAEWNLNGNVVKFTLPKAVEVVQTVRREITAKAKTGKTTLTVTGLLGIEITRKAEKKETKEAKKEVQKEQKKVESKDAQQTSQQVVIEQKVEITAPMQEQASVTRPDLQIGQIVEEVGEAETKEKERMPKEAREAGGQRVATLSNMTLDALIRCVQSELPDVDKKIVEQLVTTALQYLGRAWSVGELRLRLDISKMLSQKLKVEQEYLFELMGKILKLLKKYGIVEIVEPGIVNLLKKDIVSSGKTRLLEVLGF